WANRQCLMHWVREVFYRVFDKELSGKQMPLVYDVAHNIVKLETHEVDSGKLQKLAVHRKGATRAFAPGNPELPEKYIQTGQPVIIPGDMGTASYILTGTHQAMKETFGSTCHGAGRILSRKAAKVAAKGRQIANELESLGIIVKASGRGTIVEEMPDAYKDIDKVISIVKGAGLANVVAKMRPLGVIKG
ncbi:RtcB family protein, partial [bacterium]|nr:RtcB family protein [candidate division CSSED10-310 bacterium]